MMITLDEKLHTKTRDEWIMIGGKCSVSRKCSRSLTYVPAFPRKKP